MSDASGNSYASEDENSTTSSESVESLPKRNASRLAKKSTAPTVKPITVTRRQAALAASNKEKLNLDPEGRLREKRKLEKKIVPPPPMQRKQYGTVYDSKGVHIKTGIDMCDCMQLECPGCFYECKKCNSTKCGVECRVNRKHVYEHIEYHGYNYKVKNPLET